MSNLYKNKKIKNLYLNIVHINLVINFLDRIAGRGCILIIYYQGLGARDFIVLRLVYDQYIGDGDGGGDGDGD